ncbi:alpha/beta hydrolase [Ramlibacter tataouinensis]|uniref:alpha/beta fold hydrolase n=1 Tax=Ramlibacter tataouinensis TaxID=94132 RepID=UPI0022F3E0F2|nr:alpha/beta hydrolase [Ramlibacter tataouinensis]WBY02385.1 alpha/beta hydrolase [Ramlibacter tataouinensis]
MTAIRAQRRYVDALGVRTAYYRAGSGPVLVLLHGSSPGACSELNWFRNFDALAEAGFDVLAFDQPGFGYSSAPQDHGVEFRYRHAVAVLQALQVGRAVLVGNSLGGLLAVLLHGRQREAGLRIDGLVLAAQFPHFEIPAPTRARMQQHLARLGGVEPTAQSVRALTANTLADHANLTDELLQLRLDMLARTYEAHQARGRAGMQFDAQAIRATPVDAPSLVVWGLDDHSLPAEIGIEAMQHFSNAEFVFLPRCGHWPQTEHAGRFNRLATEFAQRVSA